MIYLEVVFYGYVWFEVIMWVFWLEIKSILVYYEVLNVMV